MECNRCSFAMERIDREYHHFCWMCGNITPDKPHYHIPEGSYACLDCGTELTYEIGTDRKMRCEKCRKKFMLRRKGKSERTVNL